MIGLLTALLLQANTIPISRPAIESGSDYGACYFSELALSDDDRQIWANISPQHARRHQAHHGMRRPVNRSTVPETVVIDLACRRSDGTLAECVAPAAVMVDSQYGDQDLPDSRSIGAENTTARGRLAAFLVANPAWDIYQLLEPADQQFVVAGLVSPFGANVARVVLFDDEGAGPVDILRPCLPPWDIPSTYHRDRVQLDLAGRSFQLERVWNEVVRATGAPIENRIAIISFDPSARLPDGLGHAPNSYAMWDERADVFIVNTSQMGITPAALCRNIVASIRQAFPGRYRRVGVRSGGDGVRWVLPALDRDARCGADFAMLGFGWGWPLAETDLDGIEFGQDVPVHIRMHDERDVEFSLELVSRLISAGTPLDVRVTEPSSPLRRALYPTLPEGSVDSVRRFLEEQIEGGVRAD